MDEHPRDFSGTVDLVNARLGRMKGMIHPQTRSLCRYFEDLRGGRTVPSRAEVDPRDMPCRASNLFILEDLGRGQIRFRLAGSALTEACGQELRGLNIRSLMEGRARESMTALIEETLAEPGVGYARLARAGAPDEMWELLLLPLRSDSGSVDRVLGSLVPLGLEQAPRRRLAMRFTVAEMSIRPIRLGGTGRSEEAPAQPVAGFAEGEQAPFGGLTAIEGGLSGAAADEEARPHAQERPSPKPNLRIVRED